MSRAKEREREPLLNRSINGAGEAPPSKLKETITPTTQQGGPRFSGMTPSLLALFLILGIIRGTSTVMLKIAGRDIDPSLVVVLRSPLCVFLFLATMAMWARYSDSYSKRLRQVVKKKSTWAKLALMGLVQSAAPFLLFSYGLERLPASLGGAFMSVTPLCAILIQRTCCHWCLTAKTPVNAARVAGMIVSVIGVVLLALPQLIPTCSYSCQPLKNTTASFDLNDNQLSRDAYLRDNGNVSHCNSSETWTKICSTTEHKSHNLTDVLIGLALLIAGTFSWGFSAVFWRQYKGSIHFTLAGFGQILFGGIFSAIFWISFIKGDVSASKMHWSQTSIWSLVYLALMSGWIANFILYYLYQKIGPVAATRVLCLVPAVSWIEQNIIDDKWPSEARDLGMDVGGLILIFLGLQMFEGRTDAICGIQIPCIAKKRFTRQVQFYKPVEGLADHPEFSIEWPNEAMTEIDGAVLEVYEGELGDYALL